MMFCFGSPKFDPVVGHWPKLVLPCKWICDHISRCFNKIVKNGIPNYSCCRSPCFNSVTTRYDKVQGHHNQWQLCPWIRSINLKYIPIAGQISVYINQ